MGRVMEVWLSWFCKLIVKPGNKTTAPPWPDPYVHVPRYLYVYNAISLALDASCLIFIIRNTYDHWKCDLYIEM